MTQDAGSVAPTARGGRFPWLRAADSRDPRSIRRHILVLAATTSGFAATLLVLLVQLLLANVATSTADRMLKDEIDAVRAAVEEASTGERFRAPDGVLIPGVVLYDGAGRSVAGHPPRALAEVYGELAERPPGARTIDDSHRVRSAEVTTSSGARGVVVVATRMEPYEQAERFALWITLAAGAILVGSSVSVAAWVSRRVLRPVEEMARTAEDWSEHDLSRRFGLGPPTNELTALAGTLDGLLDKVAHAIRAEQRLTAELAHELRTPLAAIMGNVELVELRGGLDPESSEDVREIREACRRMTETIATLMELARAPASLSGGARPRVVDVVAEIRTHVAAGLMPGNLALELPLGAESDDVTEEIDAPLNLVVRAVLPVVDNAVRLGSRVRVVVESGEGTVRLHIDDDGPGVPPEMADRLFQPGQTSGGGGAGLGLPLARRVALSLGGEVLLGRVDEPPYRTRFTVELPRAQRKTNRR